MARGGERQGRPGVAYPQRTDLTADPQKTQPVRATSSANYGDRTRQEQAQQAIPLPQLTPLDAPTQRPNEPVTAGAPVGPGPGPETIGLGGGPEVDELRAIYMKHPTEGLRRLIEEFEPVDKPQFKPVAGRGRAVPRLYAQKLERVARDAQRKPSKGRQ